MQSGAGIRRHGRRRAWSERVATAVPPEHFPVEHVDDEFVIED